MSSVNKAILIGNLGADPELRMAGSTPVCNFRIATNEKWTDKDGERQERTEWHSIVVWDKAGEACAKYLEKGSPVYVEGKIQTRQYEKDGDTRYATEIVASSVQFLSGGSDVHEATKTSSKPSKPAAPQRRNVPVDDDEVPW